MMTHDEMIAVIAHDKNGGKVEVSRKGGMATGEPRKWLDANNPCWNFDEYDYRIKPEPLVLWAAFYPSGELCAIHGDESVVVNLMRNESEYKLTLKKFVEVME